MTIASADLERIDLTDHDRYAHAVPYADFDRLRREDPVHWHPERSGPGFWAVTRYHDVVTVAKDTATYSSEVGAVALEDLDPDAIEARKSMIDTDPPRHAELRRLVTADFTRRRVGLRADEVRQVVRTVLAPVLPTETFDAVQQIATAVPIRVLLRILGIPRADEELMISLGDRMIAGTDPDLGDEGTGADRYRLLPFRSPAALEMREYSAWFYAAARQHDDDTSVLARLAGARIGGEALSQADYDAMFLLLVVAGNETARRAAGTRFHDHEQYGSDLTRPVHDHGGSFPVLGRVGREGFGEVEGAGVTRTSLARAAAFSGAAVSPGSRQV
jgi:cytochrome P450